MKKIKRISNLTTFLTSKDKDGKKLTLRHLLEDCKKTLHSAVPFCTYGEDDPTYKVAS